MNRPSRRRVEPLVERFVEELKTLDLRTHVRYDFRNDHLYFWVAKADDTVTTECEHGVYIDYSPSQRRIVGLSILGFEKESLSLAAKDDPELRNNWRKAKRWVRPLSWLEDIASLVGVSLEELEAERMHVPVQRWFDWLRHHPGSIKPLPVPVVA